MKLYLYERFGPSSWLHEPRRRLGRPHPLLCLNPEILFPECHCDGTMPLDVVNVRLPAVIQVLIFLFVAPWILC